MEAVRNKKMFYIDSKELTEVKGSQSRSLKLVHNLVSFFSTIQISNFFHGSNFN